MNAQEARALHKDSQESRYNNLMNKIRAAAVNFSSIELPEDDVRGLRSRLAFDRYKLTGRDGAITISWSIDNA